MNKLSKPMKLKDKIDNSFYINSYDGFFKRYKTYQEAKERQLALDEQRIIARTFEVNTIVDFDPINPKELP